MAETSEKSSFQEESPTSLRSVAQRGLHLLWVLHFVATLGAGATAAGIVLFDLLIRFARPSNFYDMHEVVVVLVLLALPNFLLSLAARSYGVANLHFLSHESYLIRRDGELDQAFLSPAALHLIRLLDQLENASVMDRQPARRQLRDWLDVHHQSLTVKELDLVQEQFGYLFDPLWKERRMP